MTGIIGRSATLVREFAARFTARRDSEPIETVPELADFIGSRAAFVTQTKLYGYLKTRMGTRWPTLFEDDVFVASINIAKAQIFAASLADLAVHAAAATGAGGRLDRAGRTALARHIHAEALASHRDALPAEVDERAWTAAFAARIEDVSWDNVAAGGDCFTESPQALIKWAPIAPELKKYDAEIVRNSIRYAWIEVRRRLRERLAAEAVAADWIADGDS